MAAHQAVPESTDVFIPLSFIAGEAYPFDWSHEHIELGGLPQIVKVAHLRLCFSRLFQVIAYPRETQEMVFDAHNRAFRFFGGLPRRGIYDNRKTAVDAIPIGKCCRAVYFTGNRPHYFGTRGERSFG